MNINPIYLQYTEVNTSFEITLTIIEKIVRERLSPSYKSIRVGASNAGGKVKFCFTVFKLDGTYNFMFQEFKNFRNWKPTTDSDRLGIEVAHLENLIESFRKGCLSGIIE